MQKLVMAMGVVVGTTGWCGQNEPDLPETAAPDSGLEEAQPDEPYIERTNRNLRNMKQGLQDQQNTRENQLDDKIGNP